MNRKLRSIPVYGWTLCATPVCGLVAGTAAAFDGGERVWWPASRVWARGLWRTAGVERVIATGTERVESLGPCILMSNHESHLDPAVLMSQFDRPLSFLAKIELFRFPVFGWAMKRVGHIPIDRGHRDKAFASIERAAREVSEGRVVIIFPEGKRADTDALLRFKKGGFVLAIKSGAPIVPVGIGGTGRVLPPGFWVKGRGRVGMVVGEPIATTGYTLETKDALMAVVRSRIEALREEARALI